MHSGNIAADAATIKTFPPPDPVEAEPSAGRRASNFLFDLVGEGLLAVALIIPDGALRGRTFALPAEIGTLADWIDERDGEANLYFTLNEPRPGQSGQAGKLRKQDVARIRALAVDLDPVENEELSSGGYTRERARLLELGNAWAANIFAPPSAIIDSGNGLQMIWALKEPLLATDATRASAEAQGRGLGKIFGAGSDAVHNLDRLFRIPFTTNLPGENKRAKGRGRTQARVLSACENRYQLSDLALFGPPSFASDDEALAHLDFNFNAVIAAAEGDDIGPELRAHADSIRDSRKGQTLLGKTDRSERDFGLVCACVERGLTDPTDVGQVAFSLAPDRLLEDEAKEKGQKYAARTINRGMQHALAGTPAGAFEKLPDERPAAAHASTAAGPTNADGWLEPFDIFGDEIDTNLADIPEDCLPPLLDQWVRSEARRKGTSTAFPAMAALVVSSAAVGQSLRIRPRQRDDWSVPGGLWGVLVAEPGSGKSPVIRPAVQPLRDLEKRISRADEARHAQWRAASQRRLKAAPAAGPEPRVRRWLADDSTSESLIPIFSDNPRGVLRVPDELSGLLGSLGAYKRQGDGDRSQLLRTFDGHEIVVDRVGKGTLRADTALMSILVGTQPDKIIQTLPFMTDDGLAQRMLFVLAERHREEGADEEPDEWAQLNYETTISKLAQAEYGSRSILSFDPEAHAVFRAALAEIKAVGDYIGTPLALRHHLGKWETILARIILALYAFDEVEMHGGVRTDLAIPADSVERYCRIARFFVRHQIAFYDRYCGPGPEAADARWFAGYLLTHPEITRVQHRTIYVARHELRGTDIQSKRKRAALMESLVLCNWARIEAREDAIPSVWSVNPQVHERYQARAEREKIERGEVRAAIENGSRARRSILGQDRMS